MCLEKDNDFRELKKVENRVLNLGFPIRIISVSGRVVPGRFVAEASSPFRKEG